MSSLTIKIGATTKEFNRKLKEIKGQTEKLEAGLAKAGKIGAVAFAGAGAAIAGAVSQAAKFERITTQFEVLTGSAQKANDTIRDLQEFSARTPFQFESIANAGKTLLSFGFQADEVKDRLQEIGDVAAVTGKDVGDLTVIFGQIAAQGKLTGERLNQLQEAGVPIGPALAKSLGIAETELRDFVSQGKVSAETFQEAFASLSQEGGLAFKGLEKVSGTLEGQISTLKDNFQLFAAEVGKEFLPLIKTATELFIGFFQTLKNNPELSKKLVVVLGLVTAFGGLTAALAAGSIAFLKIRAAILAASAASKIMAFSIKGLVGATGIGLLVILANEIFQNWNTIWPATQAVFETFVNNTKQLLSGFGNLLAGVFTLDLGKIKEGFAQLKDVAVEGYNNATEAIKANREENPPPIPGTPSEEQKESDIEENKEFLQRKNEELQATQDEIREANKEKEVERKEEEREQKVAEIEQGKMDQELVTEIQREAQEERLQNATQTRKQFLKDEQKFGTQYAKLNQAVYGGEVEQAQQAANNLVQLQNSKSDEVKAVGKAAALTQVAIDTAQGALGAYSALASIPFVGPALGVAAAGAVIAYGLERKQEILSAQTGGVVPGIGPNVDSVPAVLAPGELVTPRQNFDEVVNSVADNRARERDDGGFQEQQSQEVNISVEGEGAEEFITVRQNESRALGTSREI